MHKKGVILTLILTFLPVLHTEAQYLRTSRIVMLWDYIGKKEDNLNPDKRIQYGGIDVVSPTWFAIEGRDGTLSSLADREYVRWAHENGIKVWAVLENRSDNALTYTALSGRRGRTRIIEQIIQYAKDYDLDGINVDFEALRKETGRYFELFIMELYEKLQPPGIILSVDIPFPLGEIMEIYNIDVMAGNSDYLVMMAYDQHHAESAVSGPVAAIDWVRQGIRETLGHVSREKIILGIPFYTRVWIENTGNGRSGASSELTGMKDALEQFSGTMDKWERDSRTEQIYAEYETGSRKYRSWLEDEHSLSLKLDVINDFDLAGFSAWRSGWEWAEIWDMIDAYFE